MIVRISIYAGLPLFLSPPVSVFRSACFTVSLPFKLGKANTSLLPPFKPFHSPQVCLLSQTSAPTYGCTFQCSVSVAFSRSAILPFTSVIWYLGFCELSLTMPGLPPSGYGLPRLVDLLFLFFGGLTPLGVGWT